MYNIKLETGNATNAKQEVINHTIQQNNNQIKPLTIKTKQLYDPVAYYKVLAQKASEYQTLTALAICLPLSNMQYYGQGMHSYFNLNNRGIEGFARLSVQNDSLKKKICIFKNSLRLYELILQNKTQIETSNTQKHNDSNRFYQKTIVNPKFQYCLYLWNCRYIIWSL